MKLGGVPVEVEIARFRLRHSRKPFCIACTCESLEMVLDAHSRHLSSMAEPVDAASTTLKTVVTKVLMGKYRVLNRRFQNLASHYLFEPAACTPAAGWEKGQVSTSDNVHRHQQLAIGSSGNIS